MEQDTGKFRTNTKDQYYTKQSIAKNCVDKILKTLPETASYQWIEPSAGNGVFLKCLPNTAEKLGIDIDPKSSDIVKGDFLEWIPTSTKRRIFFGNPPFGKQSSLAKSFIKHAANYGTVLAFILPRSFVKPSMNRAFPLVFHCVYTEDLPRYAFEVNGKNYDVPCVFQIWKKQTNPRAVEQAVAEEGFVYVKREQPFDFALKRVGGLAGQCATGAKEEFNVNYHYFIQLEDRYKPHIQNILQEMNTHIFPTNTVGPRSLSKSEVNEVLNEVLQAYS